MGRVPLIKIATITKAQISEAMKRHGLKEGEISLGLVRELSDNYAPQSIKKMGGLTIKAEVVGPKMGMYGVQPVEKGMERGMTLPIEEAQLRYLENPEMFTPGRAGPMIKNVRPAIPGEAAEIGSGLAYEGLKPTFVASKAAERNKLVSTPLAEISGDENHAKWIWTMMTTDPATGKYLGEKSAAAHVWDNFRKSKNIRSSEKTIQGKRKKSVPVYANAQDYFISCFIKWRQQPAQFAKNFTRESKMLPKIWKIYGTDIP